MIKEIIIPEELRTQAQRANIERDSRNYRKVSGNMGIKERFLNRLLSSPISDQSKIWEYIKTLRRLNI